MQTSLLDNPKKSVAPDLAAIENALELVSCHHKSSAYVAAEKKTVVSNS